MNALVPVPMAFELDQLRVRVGTRQVIDGLDLRLRTGRWTALVGPNGAGKSTLLKAMGGLLPAQGRRRFLGREWHDWAPKARAQSLAWLGQNEASADDLLAGDVVMLGRLPHQKWLAPASAEDKAVVEAAMKATHTWAWRDRPLGGLSGGERQRVLLARAWAVQAKVLLMDEPLANLDPPHQADWLHSMRQQVALGHTVVSVLHEIGMALHADEVVVLAHGRVVHHGPSDDPRTHAAIEGVFEHRLRVVQVQGQWVALPV